MTNIKPTPHFGWIRGQFSGGSVDLNFDRRQNSVSGESLGDSVNISTSQDDKWVTGQAHAQEVKLEQDWSPRLVKLNGWANGARYTMTVDYDRNQANGSSAGRSIALQFDREQGWIRGQGAQGQVDVKLSQDGQLSGRLDGATVQAEMINLDLGHLLSHWYLVTR